MSEPVRPPVAEKKPHREERHGEVYEDPYHWMRERDAPEVTAYLEAENAYTEAMLAHTKALQKTLFEEMKARTKETDESVPVPIDGYFYYSRIEKGQQYHDYFRKQGSLDAEEQPILGVNALAEGHDFLQLGTFGLSPDHGLLAYSLDLSGDERYELVFKDLQSGELLPDRIPNISGSVAWSADGRTIFYCTLDEAHRPSKLYRHRLGDPVEKDVLVHEEADPAFYMGVGKTRDRKYILLEMDSNTTSEVLFLDASNPEGEFRTVGGRTHKVEYAVEHRDGRFYIVTNEEAKNFRLMEADVDNLARDAWRERIPHRPEIKLDGFDPFAGFLVLSERIAGLPALRVLDPESWEGHLVELPEEAYNVDLGSNPMFDTTLLRVEYTSLVTPETTYDYDVAARRLIQLKQEEIKGYDPSLYATERRMAAADDGTQVPISLVYRRDLRRDEGNPLLLYGYGSYGISIDLHFSPSTVSLLDRGMVYAIAHIRGGGELGRPWYEAGKLQQKRNTFDDFIRCAEYLIAEGYTRTEQLAIRGGSAGGLLMGAVVNQRPDLFGAMVAKVPFVDVVNTMLDADLPLTVIEWEEWGDPRRKPDHDYMASYSPYDRVHEADYPHMLVMSGINDPRVQYWEPAKWVAKLRTHAQGDRPILLRMEMGSGHGGATGRYRRYEELAIEFAFLLDRLGVSG